MLESPYEGNRESTIMQALDIADQAASVVWERSSAMTPVERLRLALQAATEQLEGIRAGLAAAESSAEAKGPCPLRAARRRRHESPPPGHAGRREWLPAR
jgi:hypothetical protein